VEFTEHTTNSARSEYDRRHSNRYESGDTKVNALNSFSFGTEYTTHDEERMTLETSSRTFESKGLFIIPYDRGRVVGYVRADFKVISVKNESRSLWTNPELSFYGYAHARVKKQSYGSPVQLNQRSQTFFLWHPSTQYAQIENVTSIVYVGTALGFSIEDARMHFPGPIISDFSFGFQKPGRYEVSITIGYWNPSVWQELDIPRPEQNLPDPNSLKDLPPPSDVPLGDPLTPLSPSYVSGGDYGESDPLAPPPPPTQPQAPPAPFRFRWSATVPGGNFENAVSFTYSGGAVISYEEKPVFVGSQYYIRVVSVDGIVDVPLGQGIFATQEQELAFLNTFTITGFQPE
jgi:hypothetical protein